jgi:hypothetical protein
MNAWFVTRAADVRTVLTDDRFVLDYERYQVNRMGQRALEQDYFRFGREFVALSDPPEHTKLRRIFRQPFTPKRVRDLAPGVERFCHECIDTHYTSGPVNLVHDYAGRVPQMVLRTLLNIRPEDEDLIFKWVEVFYQALEAPPMTPEQLHETNAATRESEEYFGGLIRARRARPGTDFVSDLVQINDADDDPMSDLQLAANLHLLYFAGFDTQKLTFSNMLAALARHPDALRHLAEDTSRIPDAMNELYRWDPAGHMLGRTAGEDIELSGTVIPKGDTVLICTGAASRDPEIFDEPDRFDLRRPPNGDILRYIIFGAGRHHCIGSAQAQSNLPIMLKVLIDRLGEFGIDMDSAVRHPSLASRGYDVLPLRLG